MIGWIKKKTCSHEYYLQDLHRFDDETVVGKCSKCGGVFSAAYGLALPGKLVGYRYIPCKTCSGTGKVKDYPHQEQQS